MLKRVSLETEKISRRSRRTCVQIFSSRDGALVHNLAPEHITYKLMQGSFLLSVYAAADENEARALLVFHIFVAASEERKEENVGAACRGAHCSSPVFTFALVGVIKEIRPALARWESCALCNRSEALIQSAGGGKRRERLFALLTRDRRTASTNFALDKVFNLSRLGENVAADKLIHG